MINNIFGYTYVNYIYKITLISLSFFEVFLDIFMNFEQFSSQRYFCQNIHRYFWYICKIQVPIYLYLPIFSSLQKTMREKFLKTCSLPNIFYIILIKNFNHLSPLYLGILNTFLLTNTHPFHLNSLPKALTTFSLFLSLSLGFDTQCSPSYYRFRLCLVLQKFEGKIEENKIEMKNGRREKVTCKVDKLFLYVSSNVFYLFSFFI